MASALTIFIFGIVVCLTSLIFSYFNIRKKDKFSFLNHYPYELFLISKKDNRIPWFFFCLGLLLLSSTGLCLSFKDEGLSFPIGYVAIVLPFLAFAFLTFLTLYREKWHLGAFLAFGLSSLFLSISFGFYLLTDSLAAERTFSHIAAVILLVLAIIELCLLVNPLLYRYAKMKKEVVDEEERLVRPRIIWLALTQWIYLLLDIVSTIIILLAIG